MLFLGIPDKTPVSLLKFNHDGRVVHPQVYKVTKSCGSLSVVVIVYEYKTSSVAVIIGVLVKEGGSFVFITKILKLRFEDKP